MIKAFWLLGILALLLGIVLTGCESDAQRIRATNEALDPPVATNTPVPRPTATSTPLVAEIHSLDLQDGDCINSTLPEGIDVESVDIVTCDEPWQYRVLNTIEVARSGSYPGEEVFTREALANCDKRSIWWLYPTRESWNQGDRVVSCLQESFGLSTSDPAKLDRMVGYQALRAGECYNDVPESDYFLAEVVSCSGEWEYRVTNRFEITRSGSFPGEDFIDQEAYERCEEPYDFYLFPSSETWTYGDRVVLCIEEGS